MASDSRKTWYVKVDFLRAYKCTNFPTAQQEQKLKSFHELFAEVRERVHGIRNRQDEKAVEKAEATIAYAVRLLSKPNGRTEMLTMLRTRSTTFARLTKNS